MKLVKEHHDKAEEVSNVNSEFVNNQLVNTRSNGIQITKVEQQNYFDYKFLELTQHVAMHPDRGLSRV